MPFIDSKVNTKVSKEQEQQLKDVLIAAAGEILGKSEAFSAFTGKICDAFHKVLGISPDRVYVKYYATSNWGWNGSNF